MEGRLGGRRGVMHSAAPGVWGRTMLGWVRLLTYALQARSVLSCCFVDKGLVRCDNHKQDGSTQMQ